MQAPKNEKCSMFGIDYTIWRSTCKGVRKLSDPLFRAHLQLFPFACVTLHDWSYLESETFYENYIRNGAIVHCPDLYFRDDNYIQKSDGSYRNSTLISPIMHLLTTAIGMTLHKSYVITRPNPIYCYYSGSYSSNQFHYKSEYDAFYKEVNILREQNKYFIKLDIKDFYDNINLDLLFKLIENNPGIQSSSLAPRNLQTMKEILRFSGNNKFPLVDNSICASYLSTIIYLDDVDKKIYSFIQEKIANFTNFRMIRYVDDLYVFFSSNDTKRNLEISYREIHEMFNGFLKPFKLSLNVAKSCFDYVHELPEVLKRSLYDEYIKGEEFDFADLCPTQILDFLNNLYAKSAVKPMSSMHYKEVVESTFSFEGIECQADEILNALVYSDYINYETPEIIDACLQLLQSDSYILSLDPKRLTVVMLKTKSEEVIKAFLNALFFRARNNIWNTNDTSVAINYLIQRQFKHKDLLNILHCRNQMLHSYYKRYCNGTFVALLCPTNTSKITDVVGYDAILWHLYLMHKVTFFSGDPISSYAYYKSYFDRATAIIAYKLGCEGNDKKPNHRKYHREGANLAFYSEVSNSESIIKKAHRLRNENPLAHSSAGLVESKDTAKDIENTILELESLLDEKIKVNC